MMLYHRYLGATERVSKGQSWNNLSNEIKKTRGREDGGGKGGSGVHFSLHMGGKPSQPSEEQ